MELLWALLAAAAVLWRQAAVKLASALQTFHVLRFTKKKKISKKGQVRASCLAVLEMAAKENICLSCYLSFFQDFLSESEKQVAECISKDCKCD